MSEEFFPLPSDHLGGAIAVNVFALLSTIALVSITLRVMWLGVRRLWMKSIAEPQEYVFFNTQLGQYAACLIIAMIFESAAGILGMPWLFQRGIREGLLCRAQAVVMQIGSLGAGYFTVAIAVHTFNSLVLRIRQSVIVCRTTVAVGWLASGLIAAAPFFIRERDGFIYGHDGLICGVRSIFPRYQFYFHLFPILLASILSAILYSLIFLALRGTLKINGGLKLTLNPNERWRTSDGVGENYHKFVARLSRSMLWYPVAYIMLLVPYAVTRMFVISGFSVPFPALIFAFVCWYLLSVVDVLLLYNTFRVLGPAFDARTTLSTRRDLEASRNSRTPEKMFTAGDEKQRAVLEEKIDYYRSHGPSSSVSSTAKSTDQLIPTNQQNYNWQAASIISRPITPSSDYVLNSPPPAMTSPAGRREIIHTRVDSDPAGLPAPPRRASQSPYNSLNGQPMGIPARYSNERPVDQWLSRQRSTQTFGESSPIPGRVTSWVSMSSEGSPVSGVLRSPPQSATLQPSSWDRSRSLQHSPSTVSPTLRGQRPLLLSRQGSMDTIGSRYTRPSFYPQDTTSRF